MLMMVVMVMLLCRDGDYLGYGVRCIYERNTKLGCTGCVISCLSTLQYEQVYQRHERRRLKTRTHVLLCNILNWVSGRCLRASNVGLNPTRSSLPLCFGLARSSIDDDPSPVSKTEALCVSSTESQKTSAATMLVVLLCLGSLGDVLPVAAVAQRLAQATGCSCRVITHCCYLARLKSLALSKQSCVGRLVLHGIPTSPLPMPPSPPPMSLPSLSPPPSTTSSTAAPDAGAVAAAKEEVSLCLDACRDADVLCFNLVSRFGYHIAEALGLLHRCAVVSPSISPPAPLPSNATLRWLLPHNLRRRLDEAQIGDVQDDGARPLVTRRDVEHWMLSLFLPIYSSIRTQLGLPPTPMSTQPLPPAVPVLYGVSEYVLPKPGYWPDAVTFCGPWYVDTSDGWEPPPDMAPFVETCADRLVCVDMGSMAEVGLGRDYMAIAVAVARALRAELSGLFLHFPHDVTEVEVMRKACCEDLAQPSRSTTRTATGGGGWLKVLPMSDFVSHDWLLPRCVAMIHHGGLGTTMSCIRHGVPQIVLPFTSEQSLWAERVEYLGVGMSLGPSDRLVDDDATFKRVEVAIRDVVRRSGAMSAAARELACHMAEEDGVGCAARLIEDMFFQQATDDEQREVKRTRVQDED